MSKKDDRRRAAQVELRRLRARKAEEIRPDRIVAATGTCPECDGELVEVYTARFKNEAATHWVCADCRRGWTSRREIEAPKSGAAKRRKT